jgi:hypothetical protein
MALFWGAFFAILVAGVVGLGFLTVWHPILQFLKLRDHIRARVSEIERDRTRRRQLTDQGTILATVMSRDADDELQATEQELVTLAGELASFPEHHPLAMWLLPWMRMDPLRAAEGLLALSQAIALERQDNRARHRRPGAVRRTSLSSGG